MRIRSTKPEFWRSKTIATLPWDVRLVLKGLESYVDDNGVGKDDIALIAGDVFPRDLVASPRETLARLTGALTQLAEAVLIVRYEVEGEQLIYIDRWKKFQRIDKPGKGRFRRPDGTLEYVEDVSRESYARAPETLAPGTGEQGSSGTGEQIFSSEVASATSDPLRDDVDRLCEHLADRIEGNGSKRPSIGLRWRNSARQMLDRDGLTEEQVHKAIDWCQNDEFWRANILSMPKLREKFDQLRLTASRQPRTQTTNGVDLEAAMQRATERDLADERNA